MFNLLLSSDLNQINFVKNFQNKLLDLSFVSSCDTILLSKCDLPLLPVDLYHIPFVMSIEVTVPTVIKEAVKYKLNFKRANYEGIKC